MCAGFYVLADREWIGCHRGVWHDILFMEWRSSTCGLVAER
jgi:L-amino acid N-acyltransferase YncA